MYYRFNDNTIKVEDGYPRRIDPAWTKCTVENLQQEKRSGSVTMYASTAITASMIAIVKFVAL